MNHPARKIGSIIPEPAESTRARLSPENASAPSARRRIRELSERYRISYWDGAVIAAARRAGAAVLYSEDLNDGQLYDSVQVVNPFTTGAMVQDQGGAD